MSEDDAEGGGRNEEGFKRLVTGFWLLIRSGFSRKPDGARERERGGTCGVGASEDTRVGVGDKSGKVEG